MRQLIESGLSFSRAGRALCKTHARGMPAAALKDEAAAARVAMAQGRLPPAPLDARHEAAHRRLLLGFIRHHMAEHRDLPALAFWDSAAWNDTSS